LGFSWEGTLCGTSGLLFTVILTPHSKNYNVKAPRLCTAARVEGSVVFKRLGIISPLLYIMATMFLARTNMNRNTRIPKE
jgi:hypothetical protein